MDSKPTMEETILVGDDLMLGPPSPIIPPEIASHVLQGADLCDGILRNLFLCKVSTSMTSFFFKEWKMKDLILSNNINYVQRRETNVHQFSLFATFV